MNAEKHMEHIIRDIRSMADRLEKELNSDESTEAKVEEFLHDLAWSYANFRLDVLVRRMVQEACRKSDQQ